MVCFWLIAGCLWQGFETEGRWVSGHLPNARTRYAQPGVCCNALARTLGQLKRTLEPSSQTLHPWAYAEPDPLHKESISGLTLSIWQDFGSLVNPRVCRHIHCSWCIPTSKPWTQPLLTVCFPTIVRKDRCVHLVGIIRHGWGSAGRPIGLTPAEEGPCT